MIVDGQLPPEVGGRLIWNEGWIELNYPDSLQPLVGWVSEWEDWTDEWGQPRAVYAQHIVETARQLLSGEWPPASP